MITIKCLTDGILLAILKVRMQQLQAKPTIVVRRLDTIVMPLVECNHTKFLP